MFLRDARLFDGPLPGCGGDRRWWNELAGVSHDVTISLRSREDEMHNLPRLNGAMIAPAVALLLLGACTMHSGSYQLREPYPVRPARVDQAPRTQLPFPPGEWVQLARREENSQGLLASEWVYGRIEDGRIAGLLDFWTNMTRSSTSFMVTGRCVQGTTGNVLVYVADMHGGQGAWDCVIADVRWFNGPSKTSTDWDDRLYAAAKPYGGIPKIALRIGIFAGHQDDALSVTIFHFPQRENVLGTWKPGQEGPAERA